MSGSFILQSGFWTSLLTRRGSINGRLWRGVDGNGTAGGDFVRGFRADPDNLFSGGHFDCALGDWDTSSADLRRWVRIRRHDRVVVQDTVI